MDKNRAVFFMKSNFDPFFGRMESVKVSKVHKKNGFSLVEISNMYSVYGKI